jgi:hypothetical protein
VVERWPAAVGEAIARSAWPARIARDGTVHVATADSIWAFELTQRGREIAERLGVPALRFAPGPLPGNATAEPPSPVARPGAEQWRTAAGIAAAIDDENLRKSVEKAVAFSLVRPRSDRPV